MASVYEFDHEEEVLLVKLPLCMLKCPEQQPACCLLDLQLLLPSGRVLHARAGHIARRRRRRIYSHIYAGQEPFLNLLYLCRSGTLLKFRWLQRLLQCRNSSHLQVKDYPGLLRVVAWVLNGLEIVVKRAK